MNVHLALRANVGAMWKWSGTKDWCFYFQPLRREMPGRKEKVKIMAYGYVCMC